MNSRERVMAAIGHEKVDRVPIDFGAMRFTAIMAIACNESGRYPRRVPIGLGRWRLLWSGPRLLDSFDL
jgi:hypothetical protein